MSNESADGAGVDAVPDAVREWLGAVAAERGQTEAELLQSLLADGTPASPGSPADGRALAHLEADVDEMVADLRERVIQVKREVDEKAESDHVHRDLRTSMEQLGRELGGVEARLDALDDRLAAGFENYEEILTYLTERSDELTAKIGRLASVVVDLRERVGESARDSVRRTTLTHLTDVANRHGVQKATCEDCGETVVIGLLVQPRCPHCDSGFSTLEPKTGFFQTSVLHTGRLPALESPGTAGAGEDPLQSMVEAAEQVASSPPSAPDRLTERRTEAAGPGRPTEAAEPAQGGADRRSARSSPEAAEAAEAVEAAEEPAANPSDGPAGEAVPADGSLQTLDGVGPAYAARLATAGIDGLLALAVADPEELGEAIDVSPSTVADWVEQADELTGSS